MEIGTYLERNLDTELSGNVADLCPVGALLPKPGAFSYRPWELNKIESVDVLNAIGSNIRVDARGLEVKRILPRLNDDVNEEWIDDKTRFALDGLKTQRLTVPLIRKNDQFTAATWEQALVELANKYKELNVQENEIQFVAGHLMDTETLVAAKDLANKLGSENLALDQTGGYAPVAHGVDVRNNYAFNTRIWGIEEADALLIVGSNPRWEAAVLNARIRKQWMRSPLKIGFVGEDFESTFKYDKLGENANDLKKALSGEFGKVLAEAKKPMILVGSGVTEHADAKAIYEAVGAFVDKNANFNTPEWKGYNVLQRAASRTGAYEIGFTVPSKKVAETKPKIVWLLGADEIDESDIPQGAFVVYQGHHGERGAQLADLILPGCTYTEKSGTYVNTEGRVQLSRQAVSLPGGARHDWKILRAASEYLGKPLPYDDIEALRDRCEEISPALRRYDSLELQSLGALGKVQLVDQNKNSKITGALLENPIKDFYMTDVISRRYASSSYPGDQC
jgi:NADH dehydrogenase (ubiquinone) Fe-S protein 1